MIFHQYHQKLQKFPKKKKKLFKRGLQLLMLVAGLFGYALVGWKVPWSSY